MARPAAKKPSTWAVLFGMAAMTLLMLVVAEGAFRLAGFPKADPDQSVLYYQQISLPLFHPETLADGTEVFRANDERLGSQQFLLKKTPQTYRVFAFGGSATNGLGYSPNVTFTRYLRDFLSNIYPEVNVEVINVGIIGFSTKQEKALVKHVQQEYAPDLLVFYAGNNEFLELHARMFMDRKLNAHVLAMQDRLNRSFLYRGLKQGIQRAAEARKSQQGREDNFAKFAFSESELTAGLHITASEYAYVEKRYAENIKEVVDSSVHAPVLLMTVASNLRWNDPDDQSPQWLQHYLAGHGQEVSLANPENAEAQLLKALELLQKEEQSLASQAGSKAFSLIEKEGIDAVHFRLGKVYEALGNRERARQEYELARDLDKRSRRALGVFNQAILKLKPLTQTHPNLKIIDTEAALAAHVPSGIIGYETFYDYVHFSPMGAQRMAEVIGRSLVADGFMIRRLAKRFRVTQEVPFDYEAYIQQAAVRLESRKIDYPEVDEWVGFNFDKSDVASVNLFKFREGVASLEKMAELGRMDPWIYTYLGNAHFFRLAEDEKAIKNYRQALKLLAPGDVELRGAIYHNLAVLYEKRGEKDRAEKILAFFRSYERNAKSGGEEVALDNFLRVQ